MANALFSNLYGQGYDTGILPGAHWGGASTADVYGLYDRRRRDQDAMDLLPGDAEGFNPLLPRMTAQSQGISPEQYATATQGNGVGVFGKSLGLLGLDAEGHRAAQPWGNALMQTAGTLTDPVGTGAHFVQGLDQSFQDLDHALQHPSVSPEWGREVGAPAFDITSSVAMGGGAVPKQAGTAGTFGGRLAKTADHAKLAQAEEMAGRGVPREQIWNDTGWFRGVDGKWRFEIDDSQAQLLGTTASMPEGISAPLGNVYRHDDLFSAYPKLADTRFATTQAYGPGEGAYVSLPDGRPAIAAGYAPGRVTKSDLGILNVLPHEGQHALQDIEGFAQGGRSDLGHPIKDVQREAQAAYEANRARQQKGVRTADDDLLAELGLEQPKLTKEWSDLPQREQLGWYDAGRSRLYNRLAGETEARTVQKRMDLTPEQRASRPPWLDYDVPESDQIVRFGGGSNALFSNDSRASLPGAVVQFPSRRTPDGYRAPTTRDVEHPLMDAMKGGLETTRDVHQAAGPLMQRLESMGYVPYPDHLWDTPPTPEQYANGLLNFHRANREMDAAGIERTYRHAGELGVAISPDHAAHKPLLWDDAGNKILNLHPDTPPSAIARYLKDNNLFSNSKEAAAPGVIANAAKEPQGILSPNPLPAQYKGKAPLGPLMEKLSRTTGDDTGAWFIDGDKPTYTMGGTDPRSHLDQLFGPDYAAKFDGYQSKSVPMPVQTISGKPYLHTTWFKPGAETQADTLGRLAQRTGDVLKTKQHHREYGLALGYPEDAVDAYVSKRNDLFSNSKEASLPGTIVNAGNAKAVGEPRANHSVFDVAEQVARLIGSDPSAVRHHPTSFGNSSYLGGYRISDHPVGAGRYATEGGGFDSALGADAIAEQINNSRRNQIAEMLNAPPPERQPWMNGRDWSEERQRFANRRPGWLTKEQWDTLRQRHAAGEPLGDILKKYGIVGTAGVGGGMMYEPQDAAVIEKITGAGG